MTHRELISLVSDVREALGGDRAALEAFAHAAFEARDVAADASWRRCARLQRADVAPFLSRDDVLGAAYQALNAPALEAAYRATMRERRKFTDEEIPSVTGLYTPLWLADHLVRETLGRLSKPRVCALRILDPACGTMNFGVAAIDVLREMYRQEMDHAGRPGWPAEPSVHHEREIGTAILRHNLFGIDIDPRALWLAELSLRLKLRLPNGQSVNLSHADALSDRRAGDFDVVVTNPPFASSRNLPSATMKRLKRDHPAAWRDLYACFIDRCIDLVRPGGRIGMLTMQSFMFTGAFEELRESIDARTAIESIIHLGPGLFPGGNPGTLQTVAFTLRREPQADERATQRIQAIRLVDVEDKEAALRQGSAQRYGVVQGELSRAPRAAWVYWTTPTVRQVFDNVPKLGKNAPPRQGLATSDNARFVRYGWEVEPTSPAATCRATPGRWFPYAKSGRFRRWYEAPRHRVNWQDDGREIKAEIARRYPYLKGKWQWVAKNAEWYGRSGGVTYSYLTSGRFSARRLEPGCIFDVAGSSIFPPGDPLVLLGILNSSLAAELLEVINPTLNFQVGDLGELPVPPIGGKTLIPAVSEAIELQRHVDSFDETSSDFVQPATTLDPIRSDLRRLWQIEREIDSIVAELYGVHANSQVQEPAGPEFADVARRCVSYAIGRTLGRWGGDAPNDPMVQLAPASRRLVDRVKAELAGVGGTKLVDDIERELRGIRRFVERDFYAWHVGLYARRPIYWGFRDGGRTVMLAHDRADASIVACALRSVGRVPPHGWSRSVDDGIAANLSPLADWVADRALRKFLRSVAAELPSGKLNWSETARGLSPGWTDGSGRAPSRKPPPRSSTACPGV